MALSSRQLARVPLYRQLETALRQDILSEHKPGDRLPTEPELARDFSVSIATVRQALAELARKGLVERRHGSGTYVCERSAGKHVALWIEGDVSWLSPFYFRALQTLRKALSAAGQESRPYLGFLPRLEEPGEITCRDLLSDLRQGRLKAIFSLYGRPHSSWLPEAQAHGVPVIGWGPLYSHRLMWDRETALNLMLEQLRQRGRRRLAVIGWDNWYSDRRPLYEELEKVAPQWGFQLEPAFLQLRAHGSQEGMGWQSLREIWTSCLTKPDCFLITDDTLFHGCIQAIRDLKINIPQDLDIALIAADWFQEQVDFPIIKAGFYLEELGTALCAAIRRLDEGEELPEMTLIPSSLLPSPSADWADPYLLQPPPPHELLSPPPLG